MVTIANGQAKGLHLCLENSDSHSISKHFNGLNLELEYLNKPTTCKPLKNMSSFDSNKDLLIFKPIDTTINDLLSETPTTPGSSKSTYNFKNDTDEVKFKITVNCQE